MPENNDSLSIAHAILGGAAAQLIHGPLCLTAALSLRVRGERRRLQCATCNHFIELPTGDDYDLAWRQVGQTAIIERIEGGPREVALQIDKTQGFCFHGRPMTAACPQCDAEAAGMQFVPGGPQALTGQIQPPNPTFQGEGL